MNDRMVPQEVIGYLTYTMGDEIETQSVRRYATDLLAYCTELNHKASVAELAQVRAAIMDKGDSA